MWNFDIEWDEKKDQIEKIVEMKSYVWLLTFASWIEGQLQIIFFPPDVDMIAVDFAPLKMKEWVI